MKHTFFPCPQDLEVVTDKEDSRCLHVTVHSPRSSSSAFGSSPAHVPASRNMPLLSATFTFDDHIRCMAAKQRLTKGRIKARQRKMHQIAKLLELPGSVGPACPSPPTNNLSSMRDSRKIPFFALVDTLNFPHFKGGNQESLKIQLVTFFRKLD